MSDETPQLRHEFVGMMFAITIGEVGLQAAALVQARHPAHFLPAYGHLFLATIVVATSWVGWSVSGARQDVRRVFQWEFIVLLIDVSLVITYFILVRTIDFGREGTPPRVDPASKVATLVFVIFLLYFVWDCITKIAMLKNPKDWLLNYGSRMIPTVVCLLVSGIVWQEVEVADLPHRLSADFALLCLVLLFRALKDLISAGFTKQMHPHPFLHRTKVPIAWSVVCICGITLGTLATKYSWPLPLPDWVLEEINTPGSQENGP
jgi:hypothetical protein